MDGKIKPWPPCYPAKENPKMEKALFDWPIVLQCDVKAKYRLSWFLESSRAWSVFLPERSLNQTNSTPVYIRLINQSNRSISVRLFAHFHIKVIRKSLYLLGTSVWNHDGDGDGDGSGNVENTIGLDPVYTGLDKYFNGQIFSRASRLHGTVQIPLQIAALFALQKLMQGLARPL